MEAWEIPLMAAKEPVVSRDMAKDMVNSTHMAQVPVFSRVTISSSTEATLKADMVEPMLVCKVSPGSSRMPHRLLDLMALERALRAGTLPLLEAHPSSTKTQFCCLLVR